MREDAGSVDSDIGAMSQEETDGESMSAARRQEENDGAFREWRGKGKGGQGGRGDSSDRELQLMALSPAKPPTEAVATKATEDEMKPLPADAARQFRGIASRLNYLAPTGPLCSMPSEKPPG